MMENVINHRHFFPSGREWDSDDETHRFDACEMIDGTFVVYNSDERRIIAVVQDMDDAVRIAKALANENP